MKIGIVEPQDFSLEAERKLNSIGEVSSFDNSASNLETFISDK